MAGQTSALSEHDIDIGRVEAAMERMMVEAYLYSQGLASADLAILPLGSAKQLMTAASLYASLYLAQVESRADVPTWQRAERCAG